MEIPSYLESSLDLLPRGEKEKAIKSLMLLERMEKENRINYRHFAKLIEKNRYLYKVSMKYRAIVEIDNGKIRILNILHHDKIGLAIYKGLRK